MATASNSDTEHVREILHHTPHAHKKRPHTIGHTDDHTVTHSGLPPTNTDIPHTEEHRCPQCCGYHHIYEHLRPAQTNLPSLLISPTHHTHTQPQVRPSHKHRHPHYTHISYTQAHIQQSNTDSLIPCLDAATMQELSLLPHTEPLCAPPPKKKLKDMDTLHTHRPEAQKTHRHTPILQLGYIP